MNEATRPFFFIHVMKTGGATFRQHVRNNFGPGEIYPDPQLDLERDKLRPHYDIPYLLELGPTRHARTRAYMGHFPFYVTELLNTKPITLTLLRDPVERTISYLKHCKRFHPDHKELKLEQIYADSFYRARFMDNHQTKVFSLRAEDKPDSIMDVIAIDEERLRAACDNLEKVDVLGLHTHYGEFLDAIGARFGWRFDAVPNLFIGDEPWRVSNDLRRQIAADNAFDIEFYRHAQELHARRRAGSTA